MAWGQPGPQPLDWQGRGSACPLVALLRRVIGKGLPGEVVQTGMAVSATVQ